MTPPNGTPVQAQISIVLTADGQLGTSFTIPAGRPMALMMLEEAKQQILEKFAEVKRQGHFPMVERAPPGLQIPRA